MTALLTIVQVINMAGLVGIVIAAALLYRRWYETRYVLVPVVLWAGYGVVFYGLVFAGFLSPDAVLLWGAIHRMLAVGLVLAGLVTLWVILDDDDYDDDGGDNGF